MPQISDAFATARTADWLERLRKADVIAERILAPGEWLREPHVEATKAAVQQRTLGVGDVYSARTPGSFGRTEDDLWPAPDIGEHSVAVLRDAGFAPDDIEDLLHAGAVRAAV